MASRTALRRVIGITRVNHELGIGFDPEFRGKKGNASEMTLLSVARIDFHLLEDFSLFFDRTFHRSLLIQGLGKKVAKVTIFPSDLHPFRIPWIDLETFKRFKVNGRIPDGCSVHEAFIIVGDNRFRSSQHLVDKG